MSTVLRGARVVTPDGVLEDGWVAVDDGVITRVGQGATDGTDLGGGWLVPGFVDLHMHGGGGHDVTRSRDDMAAAVAFHRGRGTTSTLVSLMAAPVDELCEQLTWVAELTRAGVVRGAHLEGPFLATARCGAQNHHHLLMPDPLVLRKLLDAAQGCLRTMTVAPELPGAVGLVHELVEAGVIAAVGHTDASYEQAMAAYAAGATLTTHLFNGMAPVTHRSPGAAIAALDAAGAVELVNDGVHVHDAVTRVVAGPRPDRVVLVTDAMSATGVGDGTYSLGDRTVEVRAGRALLQGTQRLAGSTLTMDVAFRRAVVDVRLPVEAAVRAASTNAAGLLGGGFGAIAPGLPADLVHLDDAFDVQLVVQRGRSQRPG
ncbi:MAG: N-acetylglucosamine-6-phosphate deacetylase [Jatrophihabitans sp.]|uniref:N-acetylglucosamine-6-phosphate deacetylase n=1 Tax=Jatrophihabitans sp. TaxID=1932789 RepID=UPI003F7FD1BC